jgi:hypothetical protein
LNPLHTIVFGLAVALTFIHGWATFVLRRGLKMALLTACRATNKSRKEEQTYANVRE